jgi:hypothetical protein
MVEAVTKLGNCPVCEEPWNLTRDPTDPDVWRFVLHNRTYPHKGKLINGSCPGERKTYDEAGTIKRQLDATGKQFPDE